MSPACTRRSSPLIHVRAAGQAPLGPLDPRRAAQPAPPLLNPVHWKLGAGVQVAAHAMRPGLLRTLSARDAHNLFWACGMLRIRPQQGHFLLQAASVAAQRLDELDAHVCPALCRAVL